MILRLTQGYNTQIGEGGNHLSAGQRQRVGLARAMFGSPKLMILDEPNANLDAEGEIALLQAITLLKQAACTVILVSHKPSIMSGADKLLVLRDGRIELFGSRQEVLTKLAPPAMRPGSNEGSNPQTLSP